MPACNICAALQDCALMQRPQRAEIVPITCLPFLEGAEGAFNFTEKTSEDFSPSRSAI